MIHFICFLVISETKRRVLKFYENGLAFYKKREWDKAIKEFEEVLRLNSADGPTKLYLSRCKYFKKNPPPESLLGKVNGLEAYVYLRYLFEKLAENTTGEQLAELAPHKVTPKVMDDYQKTLV